MAQDREGPVQFQVYRQPLPAAHLHLEDLPDGEPSSSGSFRGAFTGNDKGSSTASYTYNNLFYLFQLKAYDAYKDCNKMITIEIE